MRCLSRLLILCAAALLLPFGACNDDNPDQPPITPQKNAGSFTLHATYPGVRSCPGGGGIFTISVDTTQDFRGDVQLSVQADPRLHATLLRSTLVAGARVAELTIAPEIGIPVDSFGVTVTAVHGDSSKQLRLGVDVIAWEMGAAGEEVPLRNTMLAWLCKRHPELAELQSQVWWRFVTYPQHLVVEHWTFVSDVWELRMCRHVTISPYTWSLMRLRRLGTCAPELAMRREGDGSMQEIPIADYPILYGY
ncbi:MAG TPA: hypothetical protein PK916_03380 [Bacteroidota bacterium]|nr:hypothetical protein [Bacteroidota bacterium]